MGAIDEMTPSAAIAQQYCGKRIRRGADVASHIEFDDFRLRLGLRFGHVIVPFPRWPRPPHRRPCIGVRRMLLQRARGWQRDPTDGSKKLSGTEVENSKISYRTGRI